MNISRGWDTNLKLFCDPPLKTFKLSLKNIKESVRMWMSTEQMIGNKISKKKVF